MQRPFQLVILAAGCAALGACGDGNITSAALLATDWNPEIAPDNFVATIDNPYFPLVVGTIFRYRAETDDGIETGEAEGTNDTRLILGVTTTVVIDRVFLDGELVEETADWYAQDVDGNVWYFGEDAKDYENGQLVSTEGSWEAGSEGALPGIIMLATPKVGQRYPQEFAPGVAQDMGQVLSLTESVSVPAGSWEGCLQTMDSSVLDPGHRELKYYCPTVGLVLEVSPRGGRQLNELVSVE